MKQMTANMAGIVVEIFVKPGDSINEGKDIILIESMKMQIPMPASHTGKVSQIHVKKEDFINEGDPILTLE